MTADDRARAIAEVLLLRSPLDWTQSRAVARDVDAALPSDLLYIAALEDALAKITALTTAALADRRRGCPTYGLVSAPQINAIVEEARDG